MFALPLSTCASTPPAPVRHRSCIICNNARREVMLGMLMSAASVAITGDGAAASLQALQDQQLAAPGAIRNLRAAAATAAALPGTVQQSRPPSNSNRSCDVPLDPTLAAMFIQAVYTTVQQQQVMPEQQLQVERYKLQTQEYNYYAAANKDRMPALPYLDDNSGGLSNRTYYNFVSYILWKVISRHLPTPEQRTAFCTGVGEALLQQLAPDALATVQRAAGSGKAPASVLVPALQQVLGALQQGGYICNSQIVWGSQPGSWPAGWASSERVLVGEENLSEQPGPVESGFMFQVKLQQPADIEASVALRSEEDGFWSRHISSMFAALLRAGGYNPATVDEYFYQDYWQGPSSAADRLLLLFGDPLQQVDVPWKPTTLVQNWAV